MVVSNRYAEALFEESLDQKNSLLKLCDLYKGEFKTVIDSPKITDEEKIELIKSLVSKDKVFINFIKLLLEKGRINLIEDITDKYIKLLNKKEGISLITIISAKKLTKAEEDSIVSKYKSILKAKKIEYTTLIDEDLIGGVKVLADGKIYDSTVKTKLNEIFN